MVIPVEKNSQNISNAKMKKYVGNNMSLEISGGKKKDLLVVGNNCSIQLKENLSSIKVVGDNCTLRVISGGGSVIYIGNNGAVYLDQSIDEDVVTYVGKNGTVSSKNGTMRRHCSDSDVRNCGSSVKVINLDGQSNVSVPCGRTKVSVKKFTKIPSTISLPNIQIHLLT